MFMEVLIIILSIAVIMMMLTAPFPVSAVPATTPSTATPIIHHLIFNYNYGWNGSVGISVELHDKVFQLKI